MCYTFFCSTLNFNYLFGQGLLFCLTINLTVLTHLLVGYKSPDAKTNKKNNLQCNVICFFCAKIQLLSQKNQQKTIPNVELIISSGLIVSNKLCFYTFDTSVNFNVCLHFLNMKKSQL